MSSLTLLETKSDFTFSCSAFSRNVHIFYDLVLIGVSTQIYHCDEKKDMAGIFIAIVATSSLFLWLELIQMLKDNQRYIAYVLKFLRR